MNKIDIKDLEKKDDYLILKDKNITIVFSTAEKNRSFNRNTEEGKRCLDSIKKDFNVKDLLYLKQIHSNLVYTYNGERDFNENEGDGIVLDKKNIAEGVFTADCVPIVIVGEDIVSVVHSGWKGTIKGIVKEAIKKMEEKKPIKKEELKIYIGAHIRKCCYEISEELKEKFLKETQIEEKELFDGRNLSMEKVIEKDCLSIGIKEENIYSLNLCTSCTKDVKLHSYRKSEGSYGRLFTFAIIN